MIDISHKSNTLRQAIAAAIVRVSSAATIAAIENKTVPKGDVLEAARIAGLFGVKRTSDLIPDCHPLPIEYTAVRYQIKGLEVHIEMEVKTIYKTGVEVEAMHGVSVVALTMYDMLKPIDKGIEISSIRLVSKKGGKSDYRKDFDGLRGRVVVCSDSISAGQKEDKAGKVIVQRLEECGVLAPAYTVIPDEPEAIRAQVETAEKEGADVLIFTGGTGLSPRDVTPETLQPLFDRDIPGIMEAARSYGQERMPYAMLSRSVAGIKGNTLILALPGSTNGARETMDALFPHVLHLVNVMKGKRHD